MASEIIIKNISSNVANHWYGSDFPTIEDVLDLNIDIHNGSIVQMIRVEYDLIEETRRFAPTVNGYGKVLVRTNIREIVIEQREFQYKRNGKHSWKEVA